MIQGFYWKLIIMCLTLYAIRFLPFVFLRKEITNRFVKSFLTYVPYVTLAVMTFPAILEATENIWSGLAALVVGVIVAWIGGNLIVTASACCIAVLIVGAIL